MIEQLTVDQAILNFFSYYSKLQKKKYITPSEATIQYFLYSRFKLKRSITTISRHVNKLARLGYFELTRRNPLIKDGVINYQTNLYNLTDMVYKSVYFIMKSSETALKGLAKFYKHTRAKVSRKGLPQPPYKKQPLKPNKNPPLLLPKRDDKALNGFKLIPLSDLFPGLSGHEITLRINALKKKYKTDSFIEALWLEGYL